MAAAGEKRVYGEISKTAEAPEGLFVAGILSAEERDFDGELIRADAFREAAPRWLAEWGNVREAHDPHRVAGKALSVTTGDDNVTRIECRVLDASSAEKVRAGVLKGFSVRALVAPGGRNAKDPTIIEKFSDILEVSLVDRPALPAARVEVFKAMAPRPSARQPAPARHLDILAKRARLRGVVDELEKALAAAERERPAEVRPGQVTPTGEVENLAAQFLALSGERLSADLGAARRQIARHR